MASLSLTKSLLSMFGANTSTGGQSSGGIGGELLKGVFGLFGSAGGGSGGETPFANALLGGLFQNAGTVNHYASGGAATPIDLGLTMMDTMKREGPLAVPIVASRGEEILSTRKGDAQFYRALKRSSVWDDMKQIHVHNFAVGGTVGAGTISYSEPRYRPGQRVPSNNVVVVTQHISPLDANSLRRTYDLLLNNCYWIIWVSRIWN